MPPTAQMVRRLPRGEGSGPPTAILVLVIALAGLSAAQIPALMALWAEDRTLLTDLAGHGPDPLGFHVVPGSIIFAIPVLAAAALTSFVLASLLVLSVRGEFTFDVLAACGCLQGGLIAAAYLIVLGVRSLGEAILPILERGGDPVMTARSVEWFARYHRLGSGGGLAPCLDLRRLSGRTRAQRASRGAAATHADRSGDCGP